LIHSVRRFFFANEKESRPDDVPVDSIEERGRHPRVVLAEIDALFLAGI
jgi:hypothetical protein